MVFGATLLMLAMQDAWAQSGFSLLGPTGNGGDGYQTGQLGYPLPGDIGSAKNIGEGYRRNTPVLYYSCPANFSTYFGSNGVAAVDSAFAIMNSLSNVDSYSQSLSEFPDYSLHVNYMAQSLALTDLKSITLGLVFEEMGLADPIQYTWTLRDRRHVGPDPCPAGMEYLVVQRTFAGDLNQQNIYTPYVNDVLYTYTIDENCNGAMTVPSSPDPFAIIDSPVAAMPGTGLDPGYYYNGFTRSDIVGLRYLYSSNNLATETAAAGSQQLITNSSPPVILVTQPFGALLAAESSNSPDALQAMFPGLEIATTTNFPALQITTNASIYYTNTPGPSITNYQGISVDSLVSNMDLGLFIRQAATNSPAQLLALYPGLIIVSSNAYFTNIPMPNIVTSFQNVYGSPPGTVKLVTVTNYTPDFLLYYTYVFGNIYTNSYSSNSYETIQTVTVKTPSGAPLGSPGITNTTTTKFLVHQPGGEFFIMPTNWCGFKVIQTYGPYGTISSSNTVVLTNFASGTSVFTGTQTTSTLFTNHYYVIEPGICEPVAFFATNYTTNIVVQYQTTFANIVTNFYSSNSIETVTITNIGPCTNGIVGTLCTNVTTRQVTLTNVPSGDFFIPPAAWCGYTILSNYLTTPVYATNTVAAVIPAGIADIGEQYNVTTITVYTNHTYLVAPLTCAATATTVALRGGIENVKYVRANYDDLISQLFQPITNNYTMIAVSNSQRVVQYMRRIITAPDILFTTQDSAGFGNAAIATRNINFNQANVLPGLAGPGTIDPPTTITFNRSAPFYFNSVENDFLRTNAFFTPPSELTQTNVFAWGSFDASTNSPTVYPDGTSVYNLLNQILVQITPPPPTLPDATNNVPYPGVTFNATGGPFSPPFTWSLPVGYVLPAGLALSSTGTISGTPTNNPVGIYDFVIQLTDSLSRTVTWNYSINVPQ